MERTHRMNMQTATIDRAPERDLYGKLIGVIQSRHQVETLCESLQAIGIREIEILDGPTGVTQVEKWKGSVSQYFFGDMEDKMLRSYLNAVTNNLIVFAAVVDSDNANDAAEKAKTNGATGVTHFVHSVITNY